MTNKKLVLAPGALDNVPEEDHDELYAELQKMVEDGTLLENSEPVNMEELSLEDPELYAQLIDSMNNINKLQ